MFIKKTFQNNPIKIIKRHFKNKKYIYLNPKDLFELESGFE